MNHLYNCVVWFGTKESSKDKVVLKTDMIVGDFKNIKICSL